MNSKYLQYTFGVSSCISPTRLIRCFLLSKQRRNWSGHHEQRVGPEVEMRFATWTTSFAKSSLTNGWWTWGSRYLKPPLQPASKNQRKGVKNQGSNDINTQWRALSSTRSRSARRHTDLATCNDDAAAQTWLLIIITINRRCKCSTWVTSTGNDEGAERRQLRISSINPRFQLLSTCVAVKLCAGQCSLKILWVAKWIAVLYGFRN